MMNEAFKLLISLTLSGSVLISVLFILRPLLRDRLSKRWQYYIWLLVIARLLLPFGPPESPAQDAVISMDNAAVTVIGYDPKQGASDTNPDFETERNSPEPTTLQEFAASVWGHMWVIWLTGALALLIRKITAYQSFARYIRTGWEPVDDPALLDRLAEIGLEAGIKRPIELYVNPIAASPMLLGIKKPCIILPTAALPDEDLRYILLHELTHYRRRDILYKWLMQVTLCIHWFNPLVHWMGREAERLGELSCDEAVIKKLDEPSRRAYGDALLRTTAAGGSYKAALPSATLGESGKLLKERLETIMKFKKPTKLAAVLSVLLAIILTATGTAAGAYTGVPVIGESGNFWSSARTMGSRFTREAHYAKPYMFDIGWNCRPQDNSLEVKLPDGSKMNVWYRDGVAALGLKKDKAAQKALSEVIVQLWKDTKDTEFPLTSPMVFYYENFGESTTPELAEEYYEDDNLPMFKTAFAMLSKPEQTSWLSKIYEGDDIAFFSVAADGLKMDSDLVKAFAEKAYTNGKYSFFSVLTNRMSKETLESWLLRAKKDKAAAFQSILMQHTGKFDELEKLEAELDKKQDEEYKKAGITRDGGTYYYQGEKLYIFLDYQPDNAFYTMAMNPKAKDSKSVKIVRDASGKITGTAYLTEAEIADLFGEKDPDEDEENSWDDNWNWNKNWDFDWNWDWNWDWDDYEDDALKEAYKAVGVTMDGKNYYYDGKLVKIFLDHRSGSSYYNLSTNPKGTINIKITRDADNKITGVAPLTQAEIDRFFGPAHDEHVVDVDIDKVSNGEYVWLGKFELEKGDQIYYDVAAESGERLTVGFAKTRARKPNPTYITVTNHRKAGEDLEVTAGPMDAPETAGTYHLFVSTKGGELKNVTGYVTIVKASETE